MTSEKAQSNKVNAARLLLNHYGYDSLSYFSLHQKKRYFFSSTGQSFLSYIIWHKIVMVSGDPIGPKHDLPLLLKEFSYFTKGAKLKSCFIGIHQNSLPLLISFGHKVFHVGDEAILSLETYNKVHLKKKVRRAERHIQQMGITCEIYTRQQLPEQYFQQIVKISDEWIEQRKQKERGFSMTLGRLPEELDERCEFVIAVKHGRVFGFLTFVPAEASKIVSLDRTRRKADAPNGLTEFLLLQAFDYYKEKGVKHISLNFATFFKKTKVRSKKPHYYAKLLLYKVLTRIYKTHQLYSFNEKFTPQWNSRYITFENRRYLPYYLLALMKTEL